MSDILINFNAELNNSNMEVKELNRLKVVLVEKKRTGIWLSEQLGVTTTTVSKWCNNVTQPTLPTLDKIATLLEIYTRDLLTSKD